MEIPDGAETLDGAKIFYMAETSCSDRFGDQGCLPVGAAHKQWPSKK